MTTRPPDAEGVLSGLKDFQRDTALYVFQRMFAEQDPSLRFLVADEVGLGKTLVARGVLALTLDHLRQLGDQRHDVVYVCSNEAIARQNLRKLNPTSAKVEVTTTRFTMLAARSGRLSRSRVNLIGITPGTSLSFGDSGGKFGERALAFALLRVAWGGEKMQGSGPARVFYLGITDQGGAARLRAKAAEFESHITDRTLTDFRVELHVLNARRRQESRPSLWEDFSELKSYFQYPRSEYDATLRARRNRFIAELREAMATVGIKALQPDLVILDEFQRFKNLLDPSEDSWANRLARSLFTHTDRQSGRPTRTLLLSATPYRMYTVAEDDTGDDHYADFVETARFLFDDQAQTDGLQEDLRSLRNGLLTVSQDEGEAARAACDAIGIRLRRVMVRTERLASTPDRNGMLRECNLEGLSLEAGDVRGYLNLATTAREIGQPEVLEYWKSGPYILNFMEGYALKKAFNDQAQSGAALDRLMEQVERGDGLLRWEDVQAYKAIDPGNARLRALIQDVIEGDVWRLIWLPPSLPYYEATSEFDKAASRLFTKRLVFSAWHLVPKVISALVSYEAERRMLATDPAAEKLEYTTEQSRRPGRLLDYRMDGKRPAGMTAFAFVFPSFALAEAADPRAIAAVIRTAGSAPTRATVMSAARSRIDELVHPLLFGRPLSGPVDARWYWAAPILLDQRAGASDLAGWLKGSGAAEAWMGRENASTQDPADSRFAAHIDEARRLIGTNGDNLGRVPEDLLEVLAELALGGPAVTALRALGRVCGGPSSYRDAPLLRAAARTAWGYRSLFNSPDVTALVRGRSDASLPYWRAALQHSVDGNLQASLDEYVHMLRDWRGFVGPSVPGMAQDLADTAYQALTLRTAAYRVDVPVARAGTIEVQAHRMRGRFAVRFGEQQSEEGSIARAEQVGIAFNSPYWPFVMSTTSIGQEGLDFHLYCHAVVHWNLPHNPVDLEQREGRVHRFKGHAIRKNIAAECRDAAYDLDEPDPWKGMFAEAARSRPPGESEVMPYWVFNPTGEGAAIERYVPTLPLSRESTRLNDLLRTVAAYRLAFGQPRQVDLMKHLLPKLGDDGVAKLLTDLKVDLSPPAVRTELQDPP